MNKNLQKKCSLFTSLLFAICCISHTEAPQDDFLSHFHDEKVAAPQKEPALPNIQDEKEEKALSAERIQQEALPQSSQPTLYFPDEDGDDDDEDSVHGEGPIYLGEFANPAGATTSNDKIEFLFENAELSTLIEYIEKQYNVKFILDDSIKPAPQGGKSVLGTKISFKTHEPLSKSDAWNVFLTFLDMAGLAAIPGPAKNIYRLASSQDPKSPLTATRAPLPTYLGVEPEMVPNNDTLIRYVYFVENASLDVIKNVVDSMKSVTSPALAIFPELRAFIITDKGANIRSMLNVIRELDQASMPESLAVIKLQRADATKAAEMYNALAKTDQPQGLAARLLGTRKQPTMTYFSEGTKVIPEPRTNSLIVIGSRDSIQKISDFILNTVDRREVLPDMPLYVYKLKFLDAENVAKILQDVTQFQSESEAAKAGGVRDGDKYFKKVTITPEKSGNRIIINADYDDYIKIHDLLEKMDVEQPQVALKVMVINIDLNDDKQFGVQLRNKKPLLDGVIGKNTNFQTTGYPGATPGGVVENTAGGGGTRLLGDLVNLATAVAPIGSTVVSLGSDAFGVWGMLKMLQSYTNATVIANPFLVTTHKYPAQVTVGETRRVQTSTVYGATNAGTPTFQDLPAMLDVRITPQISKDDLVTLNVTVILDAFTGGNDPTNISYGNRTHKQVTSSVILGNNEVLALGGLIKETVNENITKVPVLGDIPLVGWLFKNKTKKILRSSLLILITPEILQSSNNQGANLFTRDQLGDLKDMMTNLQSEEAQKDPINRAFFANPASDNNQTVKDFISQQDKYRTATIHNTQATGSAHESLAQLLEQQEGVSVRG